MKSPLRFLLLLLVLAACAAATWWFIRASEPEQLPDEKKAAMELLIDEQRGPSYFQAGASVADEQGIIWIDALAARDQVERIVRERKGDEAMKTRIFKLIDEASEPHPSRAIGGERVNLARLNLALDTAR